jgi:hypothetical protein
MLKSEDKSRSTFGLGGPSDSGIRPWATESGPSRGAQAAGTRIAGTKVAGNASIGNVGFVGLGRMGTAMAGNLAAAGHQVTAYVRRAERI